MRRWFLSIAVLSIALGIAFFNAPPAQADVPQQIIDHIADLRVQEEGLKHLRNIGKITNGDVFAKTQVIEAQIKALWLGMDIGYDTAHIEIESIGPERAHHPITETGYRSHITSPDTVAAYGGPVASVETWLETESQAPDWRREEQERRQLALF